MTHYNTAYHDITQHTMIQREIIHILTNTTKHKLSKHNITDNTQTTYYDATRHDKHKHT